MADIVAAVPGFWLLAGAALVAALVELAIIAISAMRLSRQASARAAAEGNAWEAVAALKPPTRALEIIAALVPFALAATYARAIHSSRNLLVEAMSHTDPSEKATIASQAIGGEYNTTPMGILAVGLVAAVGCVAVGLAICARLRARGLRQAATLAPAAPDAAGAWLKFPGPVPGAIIGSIALFLVLGFAPVVRAGFAGMLGKIRAFAATPVPAEAKAPMAARALDDASHLLDQSMVFARAGIGVAALLAAVLAWHLSPARARARLLGKPLSETRGSPFGPVIAGCAIAAAIGAFLAARPLRQENQLPWPAFDGGERLMAVIATPDLDGPDELERAPVIHLTPDSTGLDGQETDAETLEAKLGTLSHNYGFLHPGIPFNGLAVVVCQANTPADRVSIALRAALRGGFPHPRFVFLKRQVTDRPLLGRHWRNIARAAQTTAIEDRRDAEPGATIIPAARHATCAAVCKEIVAARRAGLDVALLLPPVAGAAARH